MKKYLLLVVAVLLSVAAFAQLEVKEGSFKDVQGFVNINTERMYDDNDRPYAVLKIKTENIVMDMFSGLERLGVTGRLRKNRVMRHTALDLRQMI